MKLHSLETEEGVRLEEYLVPGLYFVVAFTRDNGLLLIQKIEERTYAAEGDNARLQVTIRTEAAGC